MRFVLTLLKERAALVEVKQMAEKYGKSIAEAVRRRGSSTVEAIFDDVHSQRPELSAEDYLSIITQLEASGDLVLEQPHENVTSFYKYLRSAPANIWYYTSVLIALANIPVSQLLTSFPIIIVRWAVSLPTLTLLPGFVTVDAIFGRRELGRIQKIALSVVFSVVSISFVGLVLDVLSFGLNGLVVSSATAAYVILFVFLAIYRSFRDQRKEIGRH